MGMVRAGQGENSWRISHAFLGGTVWKAFEVGGAMQVVLEEHTVNLQWPNFSMVSRFLVSCANFEAEAALVEWAGKRFMLIPVSERMSLTHLPSVAVEHFVNVFVVINT